MQKENRACTRDEILSWPSSWTWKWMLTNWTDVKYVFPWCHKFAHCFPDSVWCIFERSNPEPEHCPRYELVMILFFYLFYVAKCNLGKVNLETCWPAVYHVGCPTRSRGSLRPRASSACFVVLTDDYTSIPPRWVGTPFGGPSITSHLPPTLISRWI